jgi:hypothetical protein
MEYKEKAIKDVNDVINGGDPSIHLMKFIMYFKHCEENLMKLSHYNHNEFKSVIPIITDVIISDFKKHYNVIPKSSDEYKRFFFSRQGMFDKGKRFNVHLTVTDFDLIMDSLDLEYKKYIGNEKVEKPNVSVNNQSQKKEGCYIATMVYGDYNHPNVLELRNFRDTYLKQSILGNGFVKLYYSFSPILVQKIKNYKTTNKFIKLILDKFIAKLKRRKNIC